MSAIVDKSNSRLVEKSLIQKVVEKYLSLSDDKSISWYADMPNSE